MKVDDELIKKVADVARLELSDKEVKEFVPQLKEILDSFSKLDKVNVADTKPSFQPVRLRNSLRDDNVEKCLSQEEALSNTEHKRDGFFKGPRAV